MPKVSVIVPVYNEQKYLSECLRSLTEQTLRDIEIIAINDGSTDSTLDIMQRFAEEFKGKLKIIDTGNEGIGAARNKGLDVATGEFIKFVDADDYLELNILEKMYNLAKYNNVSLVRGNYTTLIGPLRLGDANSWSKLKGEQLVDVRENKDYIITETPRVTNKLISRALMGDERFLEGTQWEDLAIMPVIIADSQKLIHMDESVSLYRMNLNTTITDFIKKVPNILDIIKCVENIDTKMAEKGLGEEYKQQVKSLYILHTLFRVENAMTWVNFPRKDKKVVVNSLTNIIDLKYPDWRDDEIIEKYKDTNPLFKLNMNRLPGFQKGYTPLADREEIEGNVRRTFR